MNITPGELASRLGLPPPTDEQARVIQAPLAPMAVVVGAGSGKSETMADGSSHKVDENYLRESIMDPNAKVVKGYAPSMPTYQGKLSDKDVDGIIEYIKSLK